MKLDRQPPFPLYLPQPAQESPLADAASDLEPAASLTTARAVWAMAREQVGFPGSGLLAWPEGVGSW